MTSELEQEFFRVFGIEPEEEQYCLWECKIPELEHVPCKKECQYQRHNIYYPEITNSVLLELICIMRTYRLTEIYREVPSVDKLKEDILKWFINQSVINEKIKHQIQQLFKDEQ